MACRLLSRTPHALQSVLGPSGPLRHSGVVCVLQCAQRLPGIPRQEPVVRRNLHNLRNKQGRGARETTAFAGRRGTGGAGGSEMMSAELRRRRAMDARATRPGRDEAAETFGT